MYALAHRLALPAITTLLAVATVPLATVGTALAADPDDPHTAPPAPEPTPIIGPLPFVESEPLLAELRALLAQRSPRKSALTAAHGALSDWLTQTRRDPLAQPTGRWLEARLLTALGRRADARAAWEALATTHGPFSDEAREVLADLDERKKNPAAAAHWRLTRSPWSPGFLAGVKKATAQLQRLGQVERAIELLEQRLLQGMDARTRTELVMLLADLHADAGHEEHAADLILQTWWSVERAPDARLTRSLRALGAVPDKDLVTFRQALWASRSEAARLRKKPPRGRGPIHDAALALIERWDDEHAEKALASLPALPADPTAPPPRKGRARAARRAADAATDPDVLVTRALARGMLLRKLDRDAEAVDAFLFIHEHFPTHPLVHEARDQAATLLRALGRDREADPLDEALLAASAPGERHRSALWRLGFSAAIARNAERASEHLRALEWRHGGDPDRHSFCWFERARYWRGRAAQLAGDAEGARALWSSLIARYPAGWYALVARTRLGSAQPRFSAPPPRASADPTHAAPPAAPPAIDVWAIAPEDPMATALALYRLGEEALAQDHLEALLDASQLPGNGRRLLSDLYELAGHTSKAERVLRHAAIPPTMPGDDPDETYYDWYPLRFEEALGQAARDNGLPSSLLAGVVSVETRFSADARSHAGAIGAAQLMKATGTAVGRKVFGKSFDARKLHDPEVNLAVAARYLADLVDRFDGHPALAVAAYNAGPAPVSRWLEARGKLELDAFVETIPFEQARRYVMRVLSDAEIYRRLYGLDGEPIALPLRFDRSARR